MNIRLLPLLAPFTACSGFCLDPPSGRWAGNPPKPKFRCHETSPRSGDGFEGSDDSIRQNDGVSSRRSLLRAASLSFAGVVSSGPASMFLRGLGGASAANAMGLVQFPCHPGELMNTYHLMRAGESGLEEEGILSTNPLFLTNREDALTSLGIAQVEEACNGMMMRGVNPSVVKYSLASKCIESANIVATKMLVGRNRIVPEYTFMDQRGAGIWDGRPLASTEAAIWAMDAAEAGKEGRNGRPPPNDDGTANETLFEQVTRLRQLMSILETQYSGDSILLIFPDGTSPALLSCLIAGIPLKDVHALNFMPGELREGVNMDTANQLLKEKTSSPVYNKILSVGREELQKLREEEKLRLEEKNKPRELLVNKKDVPVTGNIFNSQSQRVNDDTVINPDLFPGPDIFSFGALGSIGYMTMWRGPKDDDSEEIESIPKVSPAPVLAYANSTGTSVFEEHTTLSSAVPAMAPATIDNAFGATLLAANVVDLNPNVFEDVPVVSERERIEAAEKAMNEYLSQDDGGDGWLASMQDLMEE